MTDYAKALGFEGESDPAQDILTWAADKLLWVRDALRRLAVSGELTEVDKAELVCMIRKAQGLPVAVEPPIAIPLTAHHLGARGASGYSDTRILGIHHIRHVGRMADDASLTFPKDGLAAIYGDNGAGKSGYTRIFRRAGSGRGDDLKKQILPDVFAEGPTGDASAVIEVEQSGACAPLSWNAADPELRIPGLWVFDSDATHAYVDSGNAIELLPFNIDIIPALIEFYDTARAEFEAEAKALSESLSRTCPQPPTGTAAAAFVRDLTEATTVEEIVAAVTLSPDQLARRDALSAQVATPQESLKALTALHPIISTAAPALALAEAAMADDALNTLRALHQEAARLRQAAADANTHLLDGHALPVGDPVWKEMWQAARKYAEALAHPGHGFPDIRPDALCPLCQQDLDDTARGRFLRLEDYVSTTIRKEADDAVRLALDGIAELEGKLEAAQGVLTNLDLSKQNPALAVDLAAWLPAMRTRRASIDEWIKGQGDLTPLPAPVADRLAKMMVTVKADMTAITAGSNTPEAMAAAQELRDLQSWVGLEGRLGDLEAFVAGQKCLAKLRACVAATNTNALTRFFNSLKDRHLSETLLKAYQAEIVALNLSRLKVTVTPKNARNSARFLIDLDGRKHTTSKLSEILSEGERRALSLAAFLAEQSIGGGAGCLVFDDPVSSLDHYWAEVIAKRLAIEAKIRQIIVFTHDLVFYDKLCTATEKAEVHLSFQRLFRRNDTGTSGHVDPVRSNWKSQKVKDRISDLRPLIAQARKKADISPDAYEFDAKGIYGRMRDTWERLVEELLFHKVVQRFSRNISTSELRYLTADPAILSRIDAGMTRTSTFSHDNPIALTDPFPEPKDMEADLKELEDVTNWLGEHHKTVNKKK